MAYCDMNGNCYPAPPAEPPSPAPATPKFPSQLPPPLPSTPLLPPFSRRRGEGEGGGVEGEGEGQPFVMFYGADCPYSKRVTPASLCLDAQLAASNASLRRVEVSNRQNYSLYKEALSLTPCKGVPFFFNELTGESICGVTSCEKLVAWAVTES
eukprot:TRINITY_DN10516_c0_g1_i1.p1 TRINITY_DN10516_c0_g1~~TRINITY_DN10516_c0_g1_i1.p1  ORF type:complete len:154 (-),score=43.97 TRINITY_DN10516_c0_g1_i1:111-572(-)